MAPDAGLHLRARVASNERSLPLHEVRVSVSTLQALGTRCYVPSLLLGGCIPCWASVELGLVDGEAIVPPWMMAELGMAEGALLDLCNVHCAGEALAHAELVVFIPPPGRSGTSRLDPLARDAELRSAMGDDGGLHRGSGPEGPLLMMLECLGEANVIGAIRRCRVTVIASRPSLTPRTQPYPRCRACHSPISSVLLRPRQAVARPTPQRRRQRGT